MAINTLWIIPNRILRINVSGLITEEAMLVLRAELFATFEANTDKVDLVFDVTQISEIPGNAMRISLDKRAAFRHSKTGSIAVIGANPTYEIMLHSVAQVLRVTMRFFDNEAAAMNFLAEVNYQNSFETNSKRDLPK